jgi:hypothetical protein
LEGDEEGCEKKPGNEKQRWQKLEQMRKLLEKKTELAKAVSGAYFLS